MMSHPFVAAFADFWRAPSAERMSELLHEDVVLIQPLSRPMLGLSRVRDEFQRIFTLIPDLHAVVDYACPCEARVIIEFRLRGHVGARWVEWPVVDVFSLRGDKAERRISYFDALPLFFAIAATPSAWWRWWRSGAARPWSGSLTAQRPKA